MEHMIREAWNTCVGNPSRRRKRSVLRSRRLKPGTKTSHAPLDAFVLERLRYDQCRSQLVNRIMKAGVSCFLRPKHLLKIPSTCHHFSRSSGVCLQIYDVPQISNEADVTVGESYSKTPSFRWHWHFLKGEVPSFRFCAHKLQVFLPLVFITVWTHG